MNIKALYYILKDKKVVPTNSVEVWGEFFNDINNRRVAETMVSKRIRVSTVFLGLDHSFTTLKDSPPIVFETMVFGGKYNGHQDRYSTWDEAEAGHLVMVEMCKNKVLKKYL